MIKGYRDATFGTVGGPYTSAHHSPPFQIYERRIDWGRASTGSRLSIPKQCAHLLPGGTDKHLGPCGLVLCSLRYQRSRLWRVLAIPNIQPNPSDIAPLERSWQVKSPVYVRLRAVALWAMERCVAHLLGTIVELGKLRPYHSRFDWPRGYPCTILTGAENP